MGEQASRLFTMRRKLLILVAAFVAGALVWKVPQWQVATWRAFLQPRDLLMLENELRQTMALLLAAAALLVVLALLWRRSIANQRREERSFQAAQEGQRTERLTLAIGQLGAEKLEVRLGSIYALERIANESAADHWPVMEVLCAYVRERAAWEEGRPQPARLPTDIQAVLTVLGRRTLAHEDRDQQRLDLRRTDLRNADLKDVHLERALLTEAHLEEADLQGARLAGADLRSVHLTGADLVESNLKGADLREAQLQSAYLVEAHLEGADLGGAYLNGAYLGGAFLQGADLGGAHLDGAYVYKAHLEGASLHGARIITAIGMTREERERINRTADDDEVARRGKKPLRKNSSPVPEQAGAAQTAISPDDADRRRRKRA
jgi:hypothetical protein